MIANTAHSGKTTGSVVDVATWKRAGRAAVRIQAGERFYCLLQKVQAGPEAHSASSSTATGVLSQGQKAAGALRLPLTSICSRDQE